MSNKPISRRGALKFGGAALAVAAAAGIVAPPSPALAAQPQPLQIPPILMGDLHNGIRSFNLMVKAGRTSFFDGVSTDTMGINGTYLGPVLRLTQGETVRMNVTNVLNTNTTLHWHGFNLPASADGGPHQEISPGKVWSPQFEVREKASTMWYHSHQMHKTADQVWAGLAGMIIIDDIEADVLTLPAIYGIDDIPVVLQDRTFQSDGQMPYAPSMHSKMMGMTGDTAMVNGTIAPFFVVTTRLIRLRLLNGSNGSIYDLAFDDGRAFEQIASDGGLLEAPVEMRGLRLAPGERAEIVVDMSGGAGAMLRGKVAGGRMGGGMGDGPVFDFLELRPFKTLVHSDALPTKLTHIPAALPGNAQKTRKFELQMSGMGMFAKFRINGKSMKMNRIDEVVEKGVTEIWEISNTSPMAHPFHVHNTQFRILDRNGAKPDAGERGLKDTVLVNPQELVRILVRFDHYTDPKRPYMYHCHILEHEDAGMMGQFTVV